ncbi:MAG: IS1634 family transposase [Pseudomonadota bacterium]
MYIRRTTIKSRKDGNQYYTYRLVESQRTGKKIHQYTLLNLGTNFETPREQWSILCSRIQDIISGQNTLFESSESIEQAAQMYAARIIQSQKQPVSDDEQDYRDIDINSLNMLRPRSVSCEHVALETFRLLGLDEKLKKIGFTGPALAAVTGSIIGRMCTPGSELSTHYWLQNISGLGELINYDFNDTTLYRMYQVSDQLVKHKQSIEQSLFEKEKHLFNLKETLTLYDLTNTYFEGSGLFNEVAEYGHSKEKRSDCPLVTLGLVLDGSGFPKRSKIFKGNVVESSTLSEMIKGLEGDEKATIVMDAGIATNENVQWLKENRYSYIVVSRNRHREFDPEQAVIVKQDDQCTVKAQKVIDPETKEALLYCHSTQREKKEAAISHGFTRRFEEAMAKLEKGLNQPRCLKKYEKVLEQIGRIKQKFSKAAKQYDIKVTQNEKAGNATNIIWEKKNIPETKDSLPGVYCLRTSHIDMNESDLWHTYTMLTDLEAVFRSLKSELGLRPVFHQITDRVTGHLFITLIAYHLVHSIRYRLKQSGIHASWDDLRKFLTGQSRVTITMQCKNGDVVHIRKSTQPEPDQQKIYNVLGLKPNPGRTIKKIIKNEQK